jgi:hypothetical protein
MAVATKRKQFEIWLPGMEDHPNQKAFVDSLAKRVIVRAGRRGGKTVGAAIKAVRMFLEGKRILYGVPTMEQLGKFWYEVCQALDEPIRAGIFKKNEAEHTITRVGTQSRIKGKTVWNADSLRGDFADFLILDEFQLMCEDTWTDVGAPMLLDTDGDALFIYTPPSLKSAGFSKARDPRHASKMYRQAEADDTGRWAYFTFSSFANPNLSTIALDEIIKDMSDLSYRKEILAEDDDVESSWLVYHAFNDAVCKIPRMSIIPEEWPRYVGHDFGGANPAALFFAQDPATGYFYAYHEYLPGGGRSTSEHVAAFKEIVGKSNVIKRVGGSHQEEEIRQAYAAHGWPIVEPKFRYVAPQVDKVIGLMELNKVFVFNDLVHYLGELMSCMWKLNDEGRPTDIINHEERFHLCAAARYILSDFTPETVASNKPQTRLSKRSR